MTGQAMISLEQEFDAFEQALSQTEDAWSELKVENRRLREALKRCLDVLEDEFQWMRSIGAGDGSNRDGSGGFVGRREVVTLSTELPHVVWSGSFRIFGVDLKCHVLSDGQRIVEADSMAALIKAMEAPGNRSNDELDDFRRWQMT